MLRSWQIVPRGTVAHNSIGAQYQLILLNKLVRRVATLALRQQIRWLHSAGDVEITGDGLSHAEWEPAEYQA